MVDDEEKSVEGTCSMVSVFCNSEVEILLENFSSRVLESLLNENNKSASAQEETFDSEALAREVEKIIESEDKLEEMTKLEKRERVRRLSEGLEDDEDVEIDETADEPKYAIQINLQSCPVKLS